MKFSMRLEEYIFAGITQHSIHVDGTTIAGTVAEQHTGKWAWFLRYPDGGIVGEETTSSWIGVRRGIELALVQEYLYGRLSDARREAALRCALTVDHSLQHSARHASCRGRYSHHSERYV